MFKLTVRAQTQGVLSLLSKTARPHALFTSQYYCGPEQPAGLSKEVCLYAGADWLQLFRQSEGGESSMFIQLFTPLTEAGV